MIFIDWSRVAEPQYDGYDVSATLCFANPVIRDNSPTVCDRTMLRTIDRLLGPNLGPADLSHPNIFKAQELLTLWPEGYNSFKSIIHTFYPLTYLDGSVHGRGSTCGSEDRKLGEMYATVTSVEGLAEAWVHEMGHTKLRYLGILLESASQLITNSPDELYSSPIRKDKLRPMTAVFHAQYSYTYVTALDLKMIRAEPKNESHLQTLEVNYKRLREGEAVIRSNLKTDDRGEQFFMGYFNWLASVLEDCEVWLGIN